MTTELMVTDATCGHCKSTIESAIQALPDVHRAELDLGDNRLRVEHGMGLDPNQIKKAIEDAGYTPENIT